MYAAGWDVMNGTYTHPHLTTLSQADQAKQFTDCAAVLAGLGFTRGAVHSSYPYTEHDATTTAAMNDAGILSGIAEAGTTPASRPGVADPFALHYLPMNATQTLSNTQTVVKAALLRGDVVLMLADSIGEGSDMSVATFQSIIDWLASIDAPFLTISQVYDRLT